MMPKISVIIPTCDNSAGFLQRAISSVLAQDYCNFEIIVVNDGHKNISRKINNNKIKYINNAENSFNALGYGSAGYARNIGILNASGEYLAFLDDDDTFLPQKLSYQIANMMKLNSEISCTDAFIGVLPFKLPFFNRRFNNYYYLILKSKLKVFNLSDIPAELKLNLLLTHNFVITSTVIAKRSLIIKVGQFNNIKAGGEILNNELIFEDWDLWKRVSKETNFSYFDEPTIYYKRGKPIKYLKFLPKKIIAALIGFSKK